MDNIIVSGLLTIGAVIAALVVVISVGPAIGRSSDAVLGSQQEASNRLRTNIEIIVAAPNAAGTQIDAWVKNVGMEPISPVSKSDVFVITPASNRFDAMTYNPAGGDNTWTESPVGSSWDRDETLHLVVTLPVASPLAAGSHQLRVSTPNGVTADLTFSR